MTQKSAVLSYGAAEAGKSRNYKMVPLTNLNKYLYSGKGEITVIINNSIERV
jgi:hypothetical protein